MDCMRYLVQYNPLDNVVKDYKLVNIGGFMNISSDRKDKINEMYREMRQNDPYGKCLILTIIPTSDNGIHTSDELKKKCRRIIFENLVSKDAIYASIVRSVIER